MVQTLRTWLVTGADKGAWHCNGACRGRRGVGELRQWDALSRSTTFAS